MDLITVQRCKNDFFNEIVTLINALGLDQKFRNNLDQIWKNNYYDRC